MPIEIKELHIKINVNEASKSISDIASNGKDKDIIAECVEQVMQVIERQKER
jgi:Family of unknown function (DUF5908)